MDFVKALLVFVINYFSAVHFVLTTEYYDGATLVRDGGKIKPPVNILRNKYLKDEDKKWYLDADTGFWGLVFTKMSIESSVRCEHDYIEIREFSNSSKQQSIPPTRYCGEIIPYPYISEKPRLEIRFISDDIWEMEGFVIHTFHATEKEMLQKRIAHYLETVANRMTFSSTQPSNNANSDNSFGGTTFYILVGSSAAALVIFGALLAYFVISIQRPNNQRTRLPDLYYITASGTQSNAPFVGLKPTPGMSTAGASRQPRKYSKDKNTIKSKTDEDVTHLDETTSKTATVSGSRSHHNNLYISNYKTGK